MRSPGPQARRDHDSLGRRLREFTNVLATTVIVATLAVLLSQTAASADDPQEEADAIAAQVSAAAPNPANEDPLDVSVSGTTLVSESDSNEYTAPVATAGEVTVEGSAGGGPLAVSLPTSLDIDPAVVATDGGTIVYPEAGEHTAVVVKTFEDGARIHTVLEDSNAPTAFDYNVDVPTGGVIEELDGGTLIIEDANGEVVGYIDTPWAKDSSGVSVPTHFEVSGNTVTQHVNHTGAGVDYPVVADPHLGKNLIKSWKWAWRSNQWTLMVYPTKWARTYGASPPGISYTIGEKGWSELKKSAGKKGLNYNLGGMKDQYICHQQFAFTKSSWNLDEKRKDVSYAKTVAKACNPAWMSGHNPNG